MSDRPTLRSLIFRRVGAVFSISVLLFTVVVGVVVHRQVHAQTDAMLLQMAHTEADGVLSELDEGVHVHDTALRLPSLNSPVVEKYAVAYGPAGHVLASTSNLAVHQLDGPWVDGLVHSGDTRVFDDDHTGPEPLRVAAFAAAAPDGDVLIFAVAAPHALIDRAVQGTVLLIALLALGLLGAVLVAANLVARRITRDLDALSDSCTALRDAPERLQVWLDGFDASAHATAETAALAGTVHALVQRLQRLVDVQSRFVAEAAHELRTPLTALQGELELALRREREAADYRAFIANARIDAARLADLAEHLLEAARARVDDLQPEALCLRDAAREAVARHARALAEAGIEVRLETDETVVCADAIATARVLDNLITNAIRHSGAATLSLVGEGPRLTVADDGRGIDADARAALFVPFAQRRGEGHGLGLFIAARLMQRQGGRLALDDDGGGTRWRCTFRPQATG